MFRRLGKEKTKLACEKLDAEGIRIEYNHKVTEKFNVSESIQDVPPEANHFHLLST